MTEVSNNQLIKYPIKHETLSKHVILKREIYIMMYCIYSITVLCPSQISTLHIIIKHKPLYYSVQNLCIEKLS